MLRNIMFLALAHMVGATQHHGVGWGWGGVGLITFLALAHMLDATQHHVSCTCTHGRCYATSWGRVGWGGADNIPCTCTHVGCYATSCFLHLHTCWMLRNIMFLALAHMVGATQHRGVGLGWGGADNIPCTCTHVGCYATSCFLHLHTWSVLRNLMGVGYIITLRSCFYDTILYDFLCALCMLLSR